MVQYPVISIDFSNLPQAVYYSPTTWCRIWWICLLGTGRRSSCGSWQASKHWRWRFYRKEYQLDQFSRHKIKKSEINIQEILNREALKKFRLFVTLFLKHKKFTKDVNGENRVLLFGGCLDVNSDIVDEFLGQKNPPSHGRYMPAAGRVFSGNLINCYEPVLQYGRLRVHHMQTWIFLWMHGLQLCQNEYQDSGYNQWSLLLR